MNKSLKNFIILAIICLIIIIIYPKSNNKTELLKEITNYENDIGIVDISVHYSNKELIFKPSIDDKYKCVGSYIIKVDGRKFSDGFNLLSKDKPISIDDVHFIHKYEDNNIIIYTFYIEYKENGNMDDEIIMYNPSSLVLLKAEKQLIEFRNWYDDLIPILNEHGLYEYNEDKIKDITSRNREKWNAELERLRNE